VVLGRPQLRRATGRALVEVAVRAEVGVLVGRLPQVARLAGVARLGRLLGVVAGAGEVPNRIAAFSEQIGQSLIEVGFEKLTPGAPTSSPGDPAVPNRARARSVQIGNMIRSWL
jgi:hypothetical protein